MDQSCDLYNRVLFLEKMIGSRSIGKLLRPNESTLIQYSKFGGALEGMD